MITTVIKFLKAYFSAGGIFIEVVPNPKLTAERNCEYYDVTCHDEFLFSFNLVSMTEDYRTDMLTPYEQVIAEVVEALIDTVEEKLELIANDGHLS